MTGPARDLLVASAGGHLTQLHLLADRLEPRRPRTWVTYDHPQARSLLAGEDVVVGFGPSSRSVAHAVRNWRLAGEVVDPGRFDRVVSTGSAIAVPFLVRAAQRGIAAHYVESATRVEGPSMSGRLLRRLSREVVLHTQHPQWADERWAPTGSVFDGFVTEGVDAPGGGLRVVVSLGTHRFPFPRLLDGLAAALRPGDEVLLQHGSTPPIALPGDVRTVASLPQGRLVEELRAADVVVAHAGTGIALTALGAGRAPVLVPRSVAHDEHVDDHQHQTAVMLAERGLAVAAEPTDLDRSALLAAARLRVAADGATASPLRLACAPV